MMYQKFISLLLIFSFLVILTACWDQRLLRDQSLVLSIGYDKGEDNTLKKTITYPKKPTGSGQQGLTEQGNNTLSMTGNTVKDAEKKMDKIITNKFDRSKARVILVGSELAAKGIYSALDSVYRDLRGPLYANLAIFDGKAEDALNIKSEQAEITSDIYAELLDSAGKAGITKNENVQLASRVILAEGKDLVLPYLSIDKTIDEAVVEGLALFHKDKMVGTLGIDETTMFLILSKQLAKHTALNLKVNDNEEDPYKQFVDITMQKNRRHIELDTSNDDVRATIDMKIDIEIDEYAADHLTNKNVVKELTKKIESELNRLAEETITKVQEANSDILGLGEKVKAYHHDTWKKINWEEVYPDIQIDVDFTVNIIRHGIIN